jgi:hypothetical protein
VKYAAIQQLFLGNGSVNSDHNGVTGKRCSLHCPCGSCDATIEELLGEVFSVRSVLRLYNEEQLQLMRESGVLRQQ